MKPVNTNPVFVMGLPRSGSTLLSRLLNATPDILSVNDLYFIQAVFARNAQAGVLSHKQAGELVATLLEVIDTRASAKEEFIGQFQVAPEILSDIRNEAMARQKQSPLMWHELLDDLLSRVAAAAGKSRWADKTPQNFYHFSLLAERFPAARFVFLLRDPRAILASYKFAKGEGHDARRYHPLAYSLYWRSAIRYYQTVKNHPRVTMIRYEDLLADPKKTCERLSEFLDTEVNTPNFAELGHNSSFSDGRRKGITQTETWLCQRFCGHEMRLLDYELSSVRPKLADLSGLVGLSLTFTLFQLMRTLTDRDARSRVLTFVRGLSR